MSVDPHLDAREGAPGSELHRFVVEPGDQDRRLDVFLHSRLEGHSRSYAKELVRERLVWVNGRTQKPSYRVVAGESVSACVEPLPDPGYLEPQDLPLHVLHEDASLIVLDKAAGLVVHPGSGRRDGTLVNALAWHFEQLSDVGGASRPGIVHRLDRETSGVMVVAKTNRAHHALAAQFHERTTEKEYLAVVEGQPSLDGDRIDAPLGRSRGDLSRIVVTPDGKPAMTQYEVVERFGGFALLRCRPRSGRTHQIRVHLQHIGHPIVCDSLYGRRKRILLSEVAGAREPGSEDPVLLDRQALHAHKLAFQHPLEGRRREFSAPLPADIESLLEGLRTYRGKTGTHGGRNR